jgi:hypothetical protein
MGPVNFMGHMGLMGHMRQFCRLWRRRLSLRSAPPAISACKASSISPGCNPGSPPQRKCTPCKGSSQMRSRQRPYNAHVEARNVIVPECVHSRRDSHRKARSRRQINGPRKARGCTPSSHRTRSVRLRAALTGRELPGATGPGISCQADGAGLTGRKHSWAVARNLRRPTTLSTSQLPATNDQ